jgi:uncharacterized membrane protein
MKSLIAGFLALSLTALTGCGDKGTPGGPGKDDPNKKPMIGTAEDTFSLDVPNLSTTIKQGETKTITIGISRGKNFDQNVVLKFENLPSGLTATPAAPTLPKGDTDVKVSLAAAADAAIGDFEIKVHGNPKTGPDAHNMFKVKVEKP